MPLLVIASRARQVRWETLTFLPVGLSFRYVTKSPDLYRCTVREKMKCYSHFFLYEHYFFRFTIRFHDVDYQVWFSNRVKMLSKTLYGKDHHLFLSCFHDYLHNKVFLFFLLE